MRVGDGTLNVVVDCCLVPQRVVVQNGSVRIIRNITAFGLGSQVYIKWYPIKIRNGKENHNMEQRIKTGLALSQKHLSLCDENRRKAQVKSRNEFVEKAIEFYPGYLNAEQNPKFFDDIFATKVQQRVETIGKTFGTGQYKIAVELSILSHLLAWQMKVSDDSLRRLRNMCSDEVKKLESFQTFEQIYNSQQERKKEV